MANIPGTDLRILALADSKQLPEAVQNAFDHFRIQAARTAIIGLIQRRGENIPELVAAVTELEALTDDTQIMRRMGDLAESIDVHRVKTGLHHDYLLLVMSQHFNPWGVIDFQRDFDNPMPYVREAADKLWALCREHGVAVESLLAKSRDPLLNTLNIHYAGVFGGTKPLRPLPEDNTDQDTEK
jgi:hypothetical protein